MSQLDNNQQSALENVLADMAEQAENVGNAINLMGLKGLGEASRFISDNLKKYSECSISLDAATLELLKQWPNKLFVIVITQ